jgi:hypothetical protein
MANERSATSLKLKETPAHSAGFFLFDWGDDLGVGREAVWWITLVTSIFFAGVGTSLYIWEFDVAVIVLMAVSIVPYLALTYMPRELLTNPLVMYGIGVFVFLVTLFIGFDSARNQIRNTSALTTISMGEKGKDTDKEIKVRVLRTGERGVLYYDPGKQAFGMLPWDTIKRLDWAITPFFDQ